MARTRRHFLAAAAGLGSSAATPAVSAPARPQNPASPTEVVSLNGAWQFVTDSSGDVQPPSKGWVDVTVPHTWQVMPEWQEYMGVAWYRKTFEPAEHWKGRTVRVEFEAVFHTASVWLNGEPAGTHEGKGYTAFTLDLTRLLRHGVENVLVVRVDNSFSETMLPRGRSSDWTHDGGIYRPVSLLVTPPAFIERVDVEAVPDLSVSGRAALEIRTLIHNAGTKGVQGLVSYRVVDEETGRTVLRGSGQAAVPASSSKEVALSRADMRRCKLWHFDHPHLYRLTVEFAGHSSSTTFGVRSFEVKDRGFWLNGERVTLMGLERMAGSHPDFGMAEPETLLQHDHDDMKELNCVFTRVHWQQDRRVLDYCDRHGILIQLEVPTWGGGTFKGMTTEPSAEIMQNGLEQLREMIARDRNHPSVVVWGLCNEIGGQNPAAAKFAQRMYEEAKGLDPRRPRTYASNSLQTSPEKDVAGAMDFVSWNEYYETWYRGTTEDLRRNLEAIGKAFPDRPVVISEYGWCSCTDQMEENDRLRIEILKNHNKAFREFPFIGGLIYFCYNDYRTHQTAKGRGLMKQRGGGVVDLYGERKPSFNVLRDESSPIASLEADESGGQLFATIRSRTEVPAYILSGYKLKWVVYGPGGSPVEQREANLPVLRPGEHAVVSAKFEEPKPQSVRFDVVRPTGFSAYRKIWKPA